MYTDKIESYIKRDRFAKMHFLGVFARDKLPEINHYPVSVVINTDPSYLPGQHWVAFYIDKNKKCSFFDSFGQKPSYYGLEKYLKINCRKLNFNKKQLQGRSSYTCGYYCVYFVVLMSRGLCLEKIINVFSEKYFSFNDFMIQKLIKDLN